MGVTSLKGKNLPPLGVNSFLLEYSLMVWANNVSILSDFSLMPKHNFHYAQVHNCVIGFTPIPKNYSRKQTVWNCNNILCCIIMNLKLQLRRKWIQVMWCHSPSGSQHKPYGHRGCYLAVKVVSNTLKRERSGSVVECLTRDRRAAGSSLTGVTALLSLSKTHLS